MSARLSATFGQFVSVFMRTRHCRHAFLADLEWLVVPAIATSQVSVAEAQDKATGLSSPIAVVLWASVSEAVDQRLATTPSQPLRLKPDEWASGTIPWLVEAAGDPRAVQALIKALVEQRFSATGLKTFMRGPTGQPLVHVLRPDAFAPPT
jgi:cytolysin-activating lysine-acyltransferase